MAAALAQVGEDGSVAVGLVAGQGLGAGAWAPLPAGQAHGFHGALEGGQLVPLPPGECEGERQACAIGHQVDLGADAPAREARRVVLRLLGIPLLRAPAAERLARTEVLSMHHRSRSIRPSAFSLSRSRSKSRSISPSRRHRLKRSQTVGHGPYRSGRSRHCAPAAGVHMSPFTTCR